MQINNYYNQLKVVESKGATGWKRKTCSFDRCRSLFYGGRKNPKNPEKTPQNNSTHISSKVHNQHATIHNWSPNWSPTKQQCRRAKKHSVTSKFENSSKSASARERQHGVENLVISPALTRYSSLNKDNYTVIFQN